jgi:hypothetical protein
MQYSHKDGKVLGSGERGEREERERERRERERMNLFREKEKIS